MLLATATAAALETREPLAIVQRAAASCALEAFTARLAIAENSLRSGTELSAHAQLVRRVVFGEPYFLPWPGSFSGAPA